MALAYSERPANGDPAGLLILHHGRGTDERDLLSLADVLDRDRRLHVVTPRAPLVLPGSSGYHWYVVPRVGSPDHDTFHSSVDELAAFHEQMWEWTGIAAERTVLGGFSQGSVMSYALGLAGGRPAPAGLLVFSGFVPTVEGWSADLQSRPELPVFIAHGRRDPVIDVAFAERAAALLSDGGAAVEYHESDVGHSIDAAHVGAASAWLGERFSAPEARPGPTRRAH